MENKNKNQKPSYLGYMMFAFGADCFIITVFAHVGHGYECATPLLRPSPSAL